MPAVRLSEYERALVGTYRLSLDDSDPLFQALPHEVGAATLELRADRTCVTVLDPVPPGGNVPMRWSASAAILTLEPPHGYPLHSRWSFTDGRRLLLVDRPAPRDAFRGHRKRKPKNERQAKAYVAAYLDHLVQGERERGGARQVWERS